MATTFGEWIKAELTKRSWNQAELARRAKISPTQITRAISGERGISIDSLEGIAKAFGLSADTLIAAYRGKITGENKEIGDPLTREADYLLSRLPEDRQRQAIEFMRFLANLEGNNDSKTFSNLGDAGTETT